ncbi:MAG: hypothetical protein A2283_06100 [Lentisphaerae bacterium RIFOXYA12_FULL_48_11]|nr:MAG: hypothetical protein A2283_06100 [Lentisphaerae bacterium RIFOXYA12_FULL_48_11]
MNLFFYDLLKKVKSWAWPIASFGGFMILVGFYLSKDETEIDLLASVMTGDPTSQDAIEMGVMFLVIGLIWKPVCAFILTSLEKTLTDNDRKKLGDHAAANSPESGEGQQKSTIGVTSSIHDPEQQAIVQKYSKLINDEYIFFTPQIPRKKLDNALGSYAKRAESSEILALVDNSPLGSAKDGALLTSATLYAHSDWLESERKVDLVDIKNVSFVKRDMHINDARFLNYSFPEQDSMQKFAEMITELAQQARRACANNPATVSSTPIQAIPPISVEISSFSCPHCNQLLEIPKEMLGQIVQCPACNGQFQIPMSEPIVVQPETAKPDVQMTPAASPPSMGQTLG